MKFSLRVFARLTFRWNQVLTRPAGSLLLALMTGLTCAVSQAEAQGSGEYPVKAAFLFNFAKFVDWPSDALGEGAPIIIGIIGDDPFGGVIDQLVAGKSASGHPVVVRRFKWGQDLRQCHILFVSQSEQKRIPQIIASLKGASVLTVGEAEQFTRQGGIIRFVLEGGKVRFEINAGAAEQARLKLSSKLLALARSVTGQ